jgi:methionyl-tRNA formyltransferase
VYAKVTVAAEIILERSLPGLLDGSAPRTPQPLVRGEYFGRRRPADGRIDWARPAAEVHNLVRAVAPPFPGAFAQVAGERWEIQRTRLSELAALPGNPRLFAAAGMCYLACGDGGVLRLLAAANAAGPIDLQLLAERIAHAPLPLS